MKAPSMLELPSWKIPQGVVSDTRPLVSSKTNQPWAYTVTVLATGGSYDLFTKSEEMFNKCVEGSIILATGRLEQVGKDLRLVPQTIEDLSQQPVGKISKTA